MGNAFITVVTLVDFAALAMCPACFIRRYSADVSEATAFWESVSVAGIS